MTYGTLNVDKVTNSDGITSGGLYGFKNRIINGAMVIDQRNAGASVTINAASTTYTLDRWSSYGQSADGVFTVQQSTTAPTGFKNSLAITVSTADSSIGASQIYIGARHKIEGFNVSDLGWGTANAQPVTISFWVRSSVTGVFGGSVLNSVQNRSYPFTYTINSANTFEYKTVTILGDTTGAWLTDNNIGIDLMFSIGMGSTYLGTAGAWAGAAYYSATGATNLISTNGATFYITGVQLEKGSTATSFDYRPYGTELALCQRYYQNIMNFSGNFYSLNAVAMSCFLPVQMRTAPTVSVISGTSITINVAGTSNQTIATPSFAANSALYLSASGGTSSTSTIGVQVNTISGAIQATAEL